MSINIDEFDFCDFGCRNGGSIQFGIKHLQGKRGFGIDIDPKMCLIMSKVPAMML